MNDDNANSNHSSPPDVNMDRDADIEALGDKINLETGRLAWPELQRHFARGVVVSVDRNLDLVEVAKLFAEDGKAEVEKLMRHGQVCRATDEQAQKWNQDKQVFWATVVAPWVLVQEADA